MVLSLAFSLSLLLTPISGLAELDLEVVVVVPSGFDEVEVGALRTVFERHGVELVVAGIPEGMVTGAAGGEIESTYPLEELAGEISDFEAVVFVEGTGLPELVKNEHHGELVQRMLRQRKFLASIGAATEALARAGAFRHEPVAGSAALGPILRENGARPVAEPVATGSRVVTAVGREQATHFARAIVDWFQRREDARKKAEALLAPGLELAELEEFEKAQAEFRRVVEAHPEEELVVVEALCAIAFCLYESGKPAKAADLFEKVAKEHPRSDQFGRSAFNAAFISQKDLDDDDRAVRLYNAVITGECSDWDLTGLLMAPYQNYRYHAYLNLGHIELERKQYPQALESYLSSWEHYASDCATCMMSALADLDAEIRPVIEKLTGIPAKEQRSSWEASAADEYLFELGKNHHEAGQADHARRAFDALVREFPESPYRKKIPPK